MTSLSAKERLRVLRKKNAVLLDKLENRSTKIEKELSSLKCAMRGKDQRKSSPSIRKNSKAWSKRNNSHQVSEVLNSRLDVVDSSTSSSDCPLPTKRPIMPSCQQTEKMTSKPVDSSSKNDKSQSAYKCYEKLDTNIPDSGHSQAIIDILSSIDYSPKSKFLRKMRSKFENKANVNIRSNLMKRSSIESELRYKTPKSSIRKKRKLAAAAVESPESSASSEFTGCLKELEVSVDGISSRKPNTYYSCNEKDSKIELIKTFRDHNWDDCHADNQACSHHKNNMSVSKDFCLPPDLHICNDRYTLNNRLFPVPVDSNCDEIVCCRSQEQVTQKKVGAIPKQVIVTVPTSLLETGDLAGNGHSQKLNFKENKPISSAIVQKLLRKPGPVNSMALRYQKGVH